MGYQKGSLHPMRRPTFTIAGPDPCPTGRILELRGIDQRSKPVVEAHPCVGGHARGEDHRLATGYTWPADASELEPAPLVPFSICSK